VGGRGLRYVSTYAVDTTYTIRLRFDGRSMLFDGHLTAYQMPLRSHRRDPLTVVTLTYLFI